jgi:hypothetical protein
VGQPAIIRSHVKKGPIGYKQRIDLPHYQRNLGRKPQRHQRSWLLPSILPHQQYHEGIAHEMCMTDGRTRKAMGARAKDWSVDLSVRRATSRKRCVGETHRQAGRGGRQYDGMSELEAQLDSGDISLFLALPFEIHARSSKRVAC